MAKDSLTIVLTFESDLKRLELIEGLTNLVGRECGLNEDELHGTLMSVHECVINTICHGNQEDPQKKVRVTFRTSATSTAGRLHLSGSAARSSTSLR